MTEQDQTQTASQDEIPTLPPPPPGAPVKKPRGFAAMSPEKQLEIARKGGRAAHAAGTAHEWTAETARLAGKLGVNAKKTKLLAKASS